MKIKLSLHRPLQKAKGLPIGALRRYANGYWFRKVNPKKWEYVGRGSAAQRALAEAKEKGLPIVSPSNRPPKQVKAKEGSQGKAPAKRGPKVNLGAKVHLESWQKRDPAGMRHEVAHQINVQHPNPVINTADISAKLRYRKPSEVVKLAVQHKVAAPEKKSPIAGWKEMGYAERYDADKARFVNEIVDEYMKLHRGKVNREVLIHRFNNVYNKAELVDKAKDLLGRDPGLKKEAKDYKTPVAPAGWSKLSYDQKIKVNKERFIYDIANARAQSLDDKPFDKNNSRDFELIVALRKNDNSRLLYRADYLLGSDPIKKEQKHQEAIKAQQAYKEMVNKDDLNTPKEQALNNADVISVKQLGSDHINEVKKLGLKLPDGSESSVAFKLISGEDQGKIRENIPTGQQWKRERLAYIVSETIGLNIVPPVVIKDVNGELGVAMQWVEGTDWCKASKAQQDAVPLNEWRRLALIDFVIGNTDRHNGNYMVNKDSKFVAIDNGLAFPENDMDEYRSAPHAMLVAKFDNKVDAYKVDPEYLANFTEDNLKKCLDAMTNYQVGGNGKELFKKRWEYIIKHKRIPRPKNAWMDIEFSNSIKEELNV